MDGSLSAVGFIAFTLPKCVLSWKLVDREFASFAELKMDTTNPDSKLLASDVESPRKPASERPTKSASKVELSPGVKAFLHRMAENLRTHDPDVPKGRYRPS